MEVLEALGDVVGVVPVMTCLGEELDYSVMVVVLTKVTVGALEKSLRYFLFARQCVVEVSSERHLYLVKPLFHVVMVGVECGGRGRVQAVLVMLVLLLDLSA